jgi:hypothetical protein
MARRNRRAGALVRRFKDAQDLLGEHHDMHVLSSAIAALRSGVSTSSFAGLDCGLATLVRLADKAALVAFDRFQAIWGGELGNRILTRADELGRALEEPVPVTSHESRVTDHGPEVTVDESPPAQPATAESPLLTGNSTALATRDS